MKNRDFLVLVTNLRIKDLDILCIKIFKLYLTKSACFCTNPLHVISVQGMIATNKYVDLLINITNDI